MAQLRSVNTRFWEDPWVETLTPNDKLLFLYLITNRHANLAGIYEITINRISFETGLNNETIRKGLKGFETIRKAYFVNENYMFLPNWLKNQNLNGNMKKGVLTIINDLPNNVKISILGNHYQTVQKDYQTVLNTLLKYEVEVLEVEDEVLEEEIEVDIFSFDEFWKLYPIKKGKVPSEKKYNNISQKDRRKIKDTLLTFINHKPFPEYKHPNPSTYLNQNRWEDELVPKQLDGNGEEKINMSKYNIPTDHLYGYTNDELLARVKEGLYPKIKML